MASLFLLSFGIFLFYVAIDLVANRLTSGQRFFFRSLVLYVLFFIVLVIMLNVGLGLSFVQVLIAELFFYFFWAFYTIFFVNVQNSFSLGLLLVFLKHPRQRIDSSELESHFALPSSLEKRVQALKRSGLIVEDSQKRLWVTARGKWISRITLFMRSILRITDVG